MAIKTMRGEVLWISLPEGAHWGDPGVQLWIDEADAIEAAAKKGGFVFKCRKMRENYVPMGGR